MDPAKKYLAHIDEDPEIAPATGMRDVSTVRRQVLFSPAYRAFSLLRAVLTFIAMLSGIDRFFGFLDAAAHAVVGTQPILLFAGGAEIGLALGVAIRPRLFGGLLGLWLLGATLIEVLGGTRPDLALRDFGLSVAAFALAQLGALYDRKPYGDHVPPGQLSGSHWRV